MSEDNTASILRVMLSDFGGILKIIEQNCNIAQGRNLAIRAAKFDKIAITDFGVVLSKNWLEEVYNTLDSHQVCSGVYQFSCNNPIQRSYQKLFEPNLDNLKADTFLPSSRSFGLNKVSLMERAYYDENLVVGEDTEFVMRLRAQKIDFGLNRDAVVFWEPRASLTEVFYQHFRYAFWDGISGANRQRSQHVFYVFSLFIISIILLYLFGSIAMFVVGVLFIAKPILKLAISGKNPFDPISYLLYNLCILSSASGYLFGCMNVKLKQK